MLRQEVLTEIDRLAYSKRPLLPEFMRNDAVHIRMYYIFMKCVYMLNDMGYPADELKTIKLEYIQELCLYDVIAASAFKSVREQNKLDFALSECRKNSENCEFCEKISKILGTTTIGEDDIEV